MSICADKADVNVGQSLFTDTDYADDAVLFAEEDVQWTSILESFDTAANTMGLHTSWAKTKIQNVASGPSPPSCVISGRQVEAVNRFTYLGSDVDSKLTNQRRILGILWYKFVTNEEVATLSQLPYINEAISRRRHSLFGHVRRMDHKALHLSVTSQHRSGQFGIWRRQPGGPRKCWVEQVTTSTGLSPSDAWSVATDRSAS